MKSIRNGWEICQQGLMKHLGNGKKINFWNDNWLPIGPLRKQISGPLRSMELSATCADLQNNREWNLEYLSIYLPWKIQP